MRMQQEKEHTAQPRRRISFSLHFISFLLNEIDSEQTDDRYISIVTSLVTLFASFFLTS